MESYYGNQHPYIYVVFPDKYNIEDYLKNIAESGIRFCVSTGFNKKEERKIETAFSVLAFINRELVKDEHFRNIISSSVRYNKQLLIVYLENVTLDATLTMQTEAQQALFINNYQNKEEFLEVFSKSEIFNRVSLTAAQLKNQRLRSVSLFSLVALVGILLFLFVLKPLLIPNTGSETMASLGLQGLSKAELESIRELRIVGNEVKDSFVHGWYENNDRSLIIYDQEIDGDMVRQEAVAAGTISDISDLAQLKNLEVLQIEGQQIKDISPLFELKNLESLSLNCNPISSLEGIEKLQKLRWLDIASTDVSDLSPIYKLNNLDGLQIDNTYVSDISGIDQLHNLSNIHIQGTYVNKIPVGPSLNYIEAHNIRLTEIPDFKGHENVVFRANKNVFKDYSNLNTAASYKLLMIEAHQNQHEIIEQLKGIPIDCFLVAGLKINDLNALKDLNIITELNISDCSLNSLDGLENFETIEMLDLKYAHNLSDLSPILNLPNLKELTISSDMAWMEYQLEGRQFELNYRDDR